LNGLPALLPPGLQGGDIGVTDFSASGVVLNYQAATGSSSTPGGTEELDLQGDNNIFIDSFNFPLNPTTFTFAGTTYDFSPFVFGAPYNTSFIIHLGADNTVIPALLGGGSFSGTSSFTGTATLVPEPASLCLLGLGGVIGLVGGIRRRKA
jgi:hypothetical protein